MIGARTSHGAGVTRQTFGALTTKEAATGFAELRYRRSTFTVVSKRSASGREHTRVSVGHAVTATCGFVDLDAHLWAAAADASAVGNVAIIVCVSNVREQAVETLCTLQVRNTAAGRAFLLARALALVDAVTWPRDTALASIDAGLAARTVRINHTIVDRFWRPARRFAAVLLAKPFEARAFDRHWNIAAVARILAVVVRHTFARHVDWRIATDAFVRLFAGFGAAGAAHCAVELTAVEARRRDAVRLFALPTLFAATHRIRGAARGFHFVYAEAPARDALVSDEAELNRACRERPGPERLRFAGVAGNALVVFVVDFDEVITRLRLETGEVHPELAHAGRTAVESIERSVCVVEVGVNGFDFERLLDPIGGETGLGLTRGVARDFIDDFDGKFFTRRKLPLLTSNQKQTRQKL